MNNSEAQIQLRKDFISSGLRRPYNSRACPNCCKDYYDQGRYITGWERGTVPRLPGTGSLGFRLGALKCNNCGFIKTFKLPTKSEGQTPAQMRTIDRVMRFFMKEQASILGHDNQPLKEWKISKAPNGWWVTVKTEGNIFVQRGAHLLVGNQGSLELWGTYDLRTDKDALNKFYSVMLNCKISKYAK